LLLKNF